MDNKIEIVCDCDRSEVLYDAIVGRSIVDVRVDGVAVSEAEYTIGVRNVAIVMDNGTEVSFSSRVTCPQWRGGRGVAMSVDALDAEYVMGKQIIAAWVDSFVSDEINDEERVIGHKTLRIIVEGYERPVGILETLNDYGEDGPSMFVEIRQEEK